MKRVALIVLVAVAARAIMLWLGERRRHQAFPASDAGALLNPARRLIQSPDGIVSAFGLRRGDVVLELGPGPGYFTPSAAVAVGPTGRIVALDLQSAMLATLRARLPAGVAVDLVAGDAMRLPIRPGVIDAAFLVSMLGEVPQPSVAIEAVAAALRPGGALAFSETMNDPDYVRLPVLRALCAAAGLVECGWRRQLLGYIARFERP